MSPTPRSKLNSLTARAVQQLGTCLGIPNASSSKKTDLIQQIMQLPSARTDKCIAEVLGRNHGGKKRKVWRWAVGIVSTLLVVVFTQNYAWIKYEIMDRYRIAIPTIAMAAQNEDLILLAPWKHLEGVVETNEHRHIATALGKTFPELTNIRSRVEILDVDAEFFDEESARRIAHRLKASAVVWGEVSGSHTEIKYLVPGSKVELPGGLVQTEYAQFAGSDYQEFVVQTLPQQAAFLALVLSGEISFKRAQLDDARELFRKAYEIVANSPHNRLTSYLLGMLGRLSPNVEEYAAFTRLSTLADTTYDWAWFNRGLSFMLQVRGDSAAIAFEKAFILTDDPENKRAIRTNIGISYGMSGLYDESEALLTELIRTDPADGIAYLNRGVANAARDKIPLAISDYNKAAEVDTTLKSIVLAKLSDLELREGNVDRADSLAGRALYGLRPRYGPTVFLQLSSTKLAQGLVDESSVWLSNASLTDLTHDLGGFIKLQRLRIASWTNDLALADSLSLSILRDYGSMTETVLIRADILRRTGRIDEARILARLVRQSRPDDLRAIGVLSEIEVDAGHFRDVYDAILRLTFGRRPLPNEAQLYLIAGVAAVRDGEPEIAKQSLSQFNRFRKQLAIDPVRQSYYDEIVNATSNINN